MDKKIWGYILAAVLTAGTITGCSSNNKPVTTEMPKESVNAAIPETPGETDRQENTTDNVKYIIKIATAGTDGDCLTYAYKIMKEEIETKTNGEIGVQIFDSSQLGSMPDYITGLQMNSIQMADIASSILTSVDSSYMIFDLPYLINDTELEKNMLNESEIGDKLADSLKNKAGILVGGNIVRSPRNVYSSKGPINTPADFKNLKIRTMDSAPMIEAMKLLGATATPIATNERYLALQTGVVDAAENNAMEIYIKKEYEVTKYLSKTEHLVQPNVVCLSPNFINSLPEEYKTIVLNAVRDGCMAGTEMDLSEVMEIEKRLQENGMIINEVEDKGAFTAMLSPVYEQYKEDVGIDLLNSVVEFVSENSKQ